MNASEALARLRRLGVPVLHTSDAAAALGQSAATASQTLKRLAHADLIRVVRHGVWWIDGPIDPMRLPDYLTAPMPSYLSMHTALHAHGLIEQIPEVFYVASLARTERITTTVATFSVHHLAPEVFGGFEETAPGVRLATAEKALFDFAYLAGGRSRLFTSLPELELPKRFSRVVLRRWVQRIPSARGRTATSQKLESLLSHAR